MAIRNCFFSDIRRKKTYSIVTLIRAMSMIQYVAIGLLVVASTLFIIVLATWENDLGTGGNPKESLERIHPSLQDQPAITLAPSPVVTKVSTNSMPMQSQVAHVDKNRMQEQIKLDFGWQQHEVYKDWRFHTGIDISGTRGQVVSAIDNGQVIEIGNDRGNGLRIGVKNDRYVIYYASLLNVTVEKGASISVGQPIGTMGSCEGEEYNHLHLAIKKGEEYIDPKLILTNE